MVEICVECEEAKRRGEKKEERRVVLVWAWVFVNLWRDVMLLLIKLHFQFSIFLFFLVFYFLFKINLSFENGVD